MVPNLPCWHGLHESKEREKNWCVARTPQHITRRGRMILAAAQGKNHAQVGRERGVKAETVRCWRKRWIGVQAVSLEDLSVSERFADLPHPGRPAQITAEHTCQMIAASL